MKGSAILATIKRVIEEFGQQAHLRILGQLSDQDRNALSGAIVSSAWYPMDSFGRYVVAENQLLYHGDRKVILANSAKIVRRQLQGVYQMFTKSDSPEYVVKRIGLVHSSYFRGISLEVVQSDPGRYVGRYTGFEQHHQIFQYSIMAFYQTALEMSGAGNVKTQFVVPMGSPKGYAEILVLWN